MNGDSERSGWMGNKFQQFHQAHERLKHRVHTAYRYPLPPWGRFMMGCVYFSVPVVLGYYASMWAISKSEATIHERFGDGSRMGPSRVAYEGDNDALRQDNKKSKIQGIGDKIVIRDEGGEEHQQTIGAGGWGGGVHLATGDQDTQEINRINLDRFLKKQLREKKKREREAAKKQRRQEAETAVAASKDG